MKKLGTPIGAGPGSAKENVGLAAVGTPPGPVGLFGFALWFACALPLPLALLLPLGLLDFVRELEGAGLCAEGFSPLP
jgi:hypothetical protein